MKKAIANPSRTAALLACAAMALALSTGSAQAQDAKAGDAAEGQRKAAMCIGCHGIKGYQASFPEVYRVPMIAGQNAKYIASALTAYQKGDRRHPSMRAVAGSLTDADMADLGAYYESLNKDGTRAPEAAVAASDDVSKLLAKGACASCHGANYSKPIDPSYPKLAGQHADYLYMSLKGYKADKAGLTGRSHAIMGAQAKPYSAAELKAMSVYLASLAGDMATVPQSKFITRTAAK